MPKIIPCLWYDDQAEEAVNFYVSIFRNSKIGKAARYGDAGPGPKGQVVSVEFELDGQPYTAINGGPMFQFTEAVSFQVNCETQAEVDYYWDALLAGGGKPSQCAWLKDRYGLSWQVVPTILGRLMSDPDAAKANRVVQAMLKMTKIEIAGLEAAAAG